MFPHPRRLSNQRPHQLEVKPQSINLVNRVVDACCSEDLQTLRVAITQKRIVEPLQDGVHNDSVKLLGYQVDGSVVGRD